MWHVFKTCNIEDSDQPAYLCHLSRAFSVSIWFFMTARFSKEEIWMAPIMWNKPHRLIYICIDFRNPKTGRKLTNICIDHRRPETGFLPLLIWSVDSNQKVSYSFWLSCLMACQTLCGSVWFIVVLSLGSEI